MIQLRSWIRVRFIDQTYGVLDTAALIPKTVGGPLEAEYGTVDCTEFLQARLMSPDPLMTGNLDPQFDPSIYFEDKSTTHPPLLPQSAARMGVHGLGAVTEARKLIAGRPEIVAIPDPLRYLIIHVINDKGRNPRWPPFTFNDASLRVPFLIPRISPIDRSATDAITKSLAFTERDIRRALDLSARIDIRHGVTKLAYEFKDRQFARVLRDYCRLEVSKA